MAAVERQPIRSALRLDPATRPSRGPRSIAVPALIAGSWAAVLAAQWTGVAAALHHHELIEGGPPLALAIPAFLAAWLVMVVAMMLPASLPAIVLVEAATARLAMARRARAAFLASFLIVWAIFGLAALLGDVVVHHLVDSTPWLAERPSLVEATILAVAGAYQLVPLKRRSLTVCRHPGARAAMPTAVPENAGRLGLRHGLACLGSSWALMLLMFGEGFGSLGWMAGLTVLMVYETTGRHGERATTAAGVFLILAAVAVLSGA